MNSIVGIGANVYDTLYTVPEYPKEDTKKQAAKAVAAGGGPCATALVAAAKLGASAGYIGYLADDVGGQFLKADMQRYGVSTEYVEIKSGYTSFSSCIWLSEEPSSRTCVFYKGDLPPLALTGAHKEAIAEAKVLMVDGNDLSTAVEGAKVAHKNGTLVLYGAGDLYDGAEKLFPYADILIPSEELALAFTGKATANEAIVSLYETFHPRTVVVTQGKRGGILYEGDGIRAYPATPAKVIDSNGAGDVFRGGFAFAAVRGFDSYRCCLFSSAVSALKCTKPGARPGAPTYKEVIHYLKELGYDEFEKDME